MTDGPDDIADQYEAHFQRQIEELQKGFDGHDVIEHSGPEMIEDKVMESNFIGLDAEVIRREKEELSAQIEEERIRREEEKAVKEFYHIPNMEIPGAFPDDKFKGMSLPSETPAGLLDKPGKTHGLDPPRWRASGGGGAHHRSLTGLSKTSRAARKFTSYSTESEYCKDKQKYLDFPDECRESNCRKLIEVRGYGLMCEDRWRWKVDVTKNLARAYFGGKNSSILLSNESWNILREHGGEEFRRIVEEHDRKEREYEERSRRLSEEGLD